jgi:hypothetical protein
MCDPPLQGHEPADRRSGLGDEPERRALRDPDDGERQRGDGGRQRVRESRAGHDEEVAAHDLLMHRPPDRRVVRVPALEQRAGREPVLDVVAVQVPRCRPARDREDDDRDGGAADPDRDHAHRWD